MKQWRKGSPNVFLGCNMLYSVYLKIEVNISHSTKYDEYPIIPHDSLGAYNKCIFTKRVSHTRTHTHARTRLKGAFSRSCNWGCARGPLNKWRNSNLNYTHPCVTRAIWNFHTHTCTPIKTATILYLLPHFRWGDFNWRHSSLWETQSALHKWLSKTWVVINITKHCTA